MKYCQRTRIEYNNKNVLTSVHIVHEDDVAAFHGNEFKKKWLEFIKDKPTFIHNNKNYYYYYDYVFAARQADSYLNAV